MAALGRYLYMISDFQATEFERKFKPHDYIQWTVENWFFCLIMVVIYLVFIVFGPKHMENLKPFDLRQPLALWNGVLSVFSTIGIIRTVPYLIGNILTLSYEETICTRPSESWGAGPCGFWVMLFIYSKVPELIDTVFVILRKKKLIFLHWYHHVTVLLFCWNAYATNAGSGLYFVAMNYTVHAVMYGYYCLQALKMMPKSFPVIIITIGQIAQMIIGTIVCFSAWYFKLSRKSCNNDMTNLIAGAVMYLSYFYLFFDFMVTRYGLLGLNRKVKIDRKVQVGDMI